MACGKVNKAFMSANVSKLLPLLLPGQCALPLDVTFNLCVLPSESAVSSNVLTPS